MWEIKRETHPRKSPSLFNQLYAYAVMTFSKTKIRRITAFMGITLWFLATLIGCKPKPSTHATTPPTGVISKDSMILIMTEGFLTESSIKWVQKQHKNTLEHTNAFYYLLFEKYAITRETFQKSLSYYHKDPKTITGMYDKVIENLNKMASTLHTKRGDTDTINSGRKQL
ncbi:MAG: hypothetical protein CSA95_03560 [Bacteroidetes bacterium]|nr:MAG: hypothetical protein CSA95_03560 [Bacteroidota bacterium]PIE88489.1 MAG: hypothetical protein CSA04_01705 [Bacteroidota bacterium]